MRKFYSGWKVAMLLSIVTWGCSKVTREDLSGSSGVPVEKAGTTSSVVLGGNSTYVVFAWNDLGMHCLNRTDREWPFRPYESQYRLL